MQNPLPSTLDHPLSKGIGYEMALVKAGTFIMGSEGEEAYDWEKPEHLVHLSQDYYIGIYPLTQEVWEAIMGAGSNPSSYRNPKYPVVDVSWQDIVEGNQDENGQASFLDQMNRNFPAPSGWVFRLPTEAEWEYAAKGGHHNSLESGQFEMKAEDLYTLYSGSDQLKEVGWYNENSHDDLKEVGKKQPNEIGLYDMIGNVEEWCSDWFDLEDSYYQQCKDSGILDNPLGPKEGHLRVVRGGAWLDDPRDCRVSYRYPWPPSGRGGLSWFSVGVGPQFHGSSERTGRNGVGKCLADLKEAWHVANEV